ncbi:hypothetical protein DL769_002037 [Monosporascus sp. CRB-8-3]|nr:hypothetical protein DL769_002037 [Monosporascus sp. CRB-8-3]
MPFLVLLLALLYLRALEYSPFSTDVEDPKVGLLQACRELGVAVVAYLPLSWGLLSSQIRGPEDFGPGDGRSAYPRFSPENFPKNMGMVRALESIAANKGCTVGQLALAWLLSRGDGIFPIPGTTKIDRLEENFNVASVELTPAEVARIRSLVDNASHGARWPRQHAFALFADTPTPEGNVQLGAKDENGI